jgi:hypothetical protein
MELIVNWMFWLSHQDRSGGAKMQSKAAEGLGQIDSSTLGLDETIKTDSEVSISILKCLKLKIFHAYS